MPVATTSLATDLMAAVLGLRRVVRRRLRSALPGPHLQGAKLELLQLVEEAPGIGVASAARRLHVAGNSVSTLVNQLVEADFLLRETDPADRRAARLFLTDAATARLERWRAARSALVGGALDRMPPADVAALDTALPALRRLLAQLTEEG
jgi:DNA-binding MarR family transcriptional regulator